MEPKAWKTLSRRLIYENPWMRLHEDVVALPDGGRTIYGVVVFGDCVGVLPFVDKDNVLLVRQYRYVQKEGHRWEMPTGGVNDGEDWEQAAQRELAEEAGFRARRLTHICSYYTSKCICDETAHLYVGEDLVPAEARPDETEFLQRRIFPFEEALQMALHGEIRDSMTLLALMLASRRRQAEAGSRRERP
ncbi:MAG: NUDIX hydrolase [Deltaproteobacteria bacterium]|nr:NUDIX hydrolase [Deltaproteobacteria bacterium]MBW2071751.1 NUDIX hydrolase [Deltaproteobacteria bacterium]